MDEKTYLLAEEEKPPMTVPAVLAALIEHKGNVSRTAKVFYRTTSRMRDFIATKPELVAALDDLRENILDKAEDNVFTAVEAGDLGQSNMVLQTLGKKRGWTNKLEITGEDGKPFAPMTVIFQQYPDDEPEALPADAGS